jgi:hypothetical protein
MTTLVARLALVFDAEKLKFAQKRANLGAFLQSPMVYGLI